MLEKILIVLQPVRFGETDRVFITGSSRIKCIGCGTVSPFSSSDWRFLLGSLSFIREAPPVGVSITLFVRSIIVGSLV